MLKVLHVITGLQRGGAETVLARLVLATSADFDHVVVSLQGDGYFGPILRARGIVVRTVDLGRWCSALARMRSLVNVIGRERPDVVQTWMYHADLLGGIAARLARARPVIWGVRNTNLDAASIGRMTRLVAWLGARVSAFIPQAIVCNSVESSHVHIAFGFDASRFHIIPNGYDVEQFRPDATARAATRAEFGVAPDEDLVGNVARWDPQKDHANLLAAMSIVAKRRPGLRVLMVGSGMEPTNEQLAVLIRAAGFERSVILAGPRDDVPAIMNALDLHVLSSMGEAFPNSVAEAMACGTPCAVTDVGDASHIVGDTGWVARPRDPMALASAVDAAFVALDRRGREAVGSRCRERIVEHFSLLRMTEAYGALWRELARRAT